MYNKYMIKKEQLLLNALKKKRMEEQGGEYLE